MHGGEVFPGEASGRRGAHARLVIHCLVPANHRALHELLRRHFRGDKWVEVVVERRSRERRGPNRRRRRDGVAPAPHIERRLIRSVEGRRMAERRATLMRVDPPPLPRRARGHASQIVFVERLESTSQAREDADTNRLLARAQAGDEGAFASVYMRYFDRLYRYLRLVLRDRHEAEDATKQVFVAALEKLPSYTIDRERPFRAWLFGIARYEFLHRRRKHRLTEISEPEQMSRHLEKDDPRRVCTLTRAEHGMLDLLSDRDFVALIGHLPLLQRQILTLRYLVDLRFNEIAQLVDRSPETVRQSHRRALAALEDVAAGAGTSPTRVRRSPIRVLLRHATVLRSRRFALFGARPASLWR